MANMTVKETGEGHWSLRLALDGGRSHQIFADIWEGRERRLVKSSEVEQPNPALLLYAPIIAFDYQRLATAMETIADHPGLKVCRWMHSARGRPYLALASSLYLFDLSADEIEDAVRLLAGQADGLEALWSGKDDE